MASNVRKKPRLDDTASPVSSTVDNGGPLSDFEKQILALGKQFPKGVPNKIIQTDSPHVGQQERAAAINNLLSLGLLDLYKQGNELLYKLKGPSNEPSQMKDADEEERVVYEIIASAENKGIWIRDIRFKSNLTMPQLNKVLKSLETKRLIKTIKSVAHAKKKVFMLYELEPDRSLTGGAFYSDQEFEVEFVNVLIQQCLRYLENKRDTADAKAKTLGPLAGRRMATATLQEISDYIKKTGISKVELSDKDIAKILKTLVHDNKIEVQDEGETKIYFARPSFGLVLGNDSIPCGVCPAARECSLDGPINPRSCVYLNNWLTNDVYSF